MNSFVVEFRVAGFTDTDWFLRGRESGIVRCTALAEYVPGKGKVVHSTSRNEHMHRYCTLTHNCDSDAIPIRKRKGTEGGRSGRERETNKECAKERCVDTDPSDADRELLPTTRALRSIFVLFPFPLTRSRLHHLYRKFSINSILMLSVSTMVSTCHTVQPL